MSVTRLNAVINSELEFKAGFRYDDQSVYFDPYLVDQVQIIDTADNSVLQTIAIGDITNPAVGIYRILTSLTWNTIPRVIIDKWRFKKNSGSTYEYLPFTTTINSVSPAPIEASIVTLQEVKNYLKIDDGTKDTLLNILLGKCTSYIEGLCQRIFASTVYEELYKTGESKRLILAHYPVSAVSVLSLDIDIENKTYDDTAEANNILIEKISGIIRLYNYMFPESEDPEVYIKYTAGYSVAEMPPDLKLVTMDLIAKKYNDIEQGRMGVTARNIMSENISYEYKDISDMNMKVIEKYINRVNVNYTPVSGWSAE